MATAPPLAARQTPARPAGNLFRVTAAVVALSVPLTIASYVLQLATGAGRCRPQPECQVHILPDVYTAFVLTTTAAAELLLGVWLLAPLVLYGVHRGDRSASIPVALGLLPTAFFSMSALPKVPLAALPPIMLLIAAVTVAIVHQRRQVLP